MSRGRLWAAIVVAAATVAAVLALAVRVAVRDADEPITAAAADTTAARPPEVSPPDRPKGLDDDGVDGAEAAVRYLLDLHPYVLASGDLREWAWMTDPACTFCDTVAAEVLGLHTDGGYVTGGAITSLGMVAEEVSPGRAVVTTLADEAPSIWTRGSTTTVLAGGASHLTVELAWDHIWRVLEVTVEEVG